MSWTSHNGETSLTIHQGDALAVLKTLPSESVHCCVTSPPYWSLRDYNCEGQIGLEETPEAYVARLVEVFREVKRVLHSDGSLWLNLGDSYAGSWGNYAPTGQGGQRPKETERWERGAYDDKTDWRPPTSNKLEGLKPKDLIGAPWRVAFALQADGWWLRSEITWCKTAPMPESVTDRPTSATEKVFLLTKQARYFYDTEAVRVPSSGDYCGSKFTDGKTAATKPRIGQGERQERTGRNLWNYWVIGPSHYPEAHFAVFPEALVEPCIKAGTSEKGCCPKCGAPWVRVVEKTTSFAGGSGAAGRDPDEINASGKWQAAALKGNRTLKAGPVVSAITTGWQPTCNCNCDETTPCIVLDPFCGSATTLWVAQRLGRNGVGIELNPDYCQLAQKRLGEHRQMKLGLEVQG